MSAATKNGLSITAIFAELDRLLAEAKAEQVALEDARPECEAQADHSTTLRPDDAAPRVLH